MNTLQRGVWSGVLANGLMTMTLLQFQKKSSLLQMHSLPPARLTDEVLPRKWTRQLSSDGRVNLTLLSHFGYSVGGALLYSLFAKKSRGRPVVSGSLFGLGVWGLSYLGWIPAFGFETNAMKMTKTRNIQMLAAHLAWGISLALANEELNQQGNKMFDALKRI